MALVTERVNLQPGLTPERLVLEFILGSPMPQVLARYMESRDFMAAKREVIEAARRLGQKQRDIPELDAVVDRLNAGIFNGSLSIYVRENAQSAVCCSYLCCCLLCLGGLIGLNPTQRFERYMVIDMATLARGGKQAEASLVEVQTVNATVVAS